ncbi:OmpA family protein [Reichenbachiella agariperforans]|uniref:OmpA family protein n=1 Tax=Reichenbachiella agariperforans TaxID=156994 RepID=UPI001C08E738|nr:OmpA family protein [Reichenbachiella agariperforans]MBU2913279.1 OmpA family protein [Reichenbachiella agariperforans]
MRTKNHLLLIVFLLFGISSLYAQEQDPPPTKKGVGIIITQSPKIIVSLEAVTDNVCHGEAKGAINISAEGGFPPYQYFWSNGSTTQDVAALEAGEYKVAVYDNFSCSDTLTVVVKQPQKMLPRIVEVKDILCYGYNQGEIDIEVEGGVAPYTYNWSNGAKTQDLKGVISGEYSVLVTDANNCQEIVRGFIDEKPLIVRSIDDVKNILCNGDQTGEVDISVQGGSPPYTYSWSNGASTEDLKDLKAGEYEVLVKDSQGCTEVSTTKVLEPELLTIGFDRINNVRCYGDNGGSINVKVDGGVFPYDYKWNTGAETQDIAGVKAGSYAVEVSDKNGCKESVSVEITQPENLLVTLVSSSDVSYYGGLDGEIDIDVTGGVAPYKYKWNNGSLTQDVEGLNSGNYNVRVSDATGCSKIINVTIGQPSALNARIDKAVDIKCNGDESGEVSIYVYGGVKPYSFLWNNGSTTEDISGLKAGKYSVVITDANNHKIEIDTVLRQPELFEASVVSVKNILCNGENRGEIDIEVKGGVEPYKYHWGNGMISQDIIDVQAGDYSVTIMDANRCQLELSASITQPDELIVNIENTVDILCYDDASGSVDITVTGGATPYQFEWSNGAKTQNISGVKTGDYQVTVTDANGCIKSVKTKLTQPELLVVREGEVKNIDCFGNNTGQINLNISGGELPYKYLWNTGDSTQNIANLKAGDYSVTITDANGCQVKYAKELTSPTKLISSLSGTVDNLCFGESNGEINIDVSGGETPYKYRWSTGATSQDVTDLKAGEYKVEIIDSNGCTDELSAYVEEKPLLEVGIDVTNILCYGESSGAIDLNVQGGVAPYKYMWSNEAVTQDIKGLKAGQYSVVVTDANGCSDIKDVMISQPSRFIAILESEVHVKCFGQSTGAINVRVSGGVQPYIYTWSNGASSQDITNIPAGTYKLTVTDANGCTELINSTIRQPSEVIYTVNEVTDLSCHGDNSGAIDISIIGGVGPYVYSWNNGATTQDLVGVSAGNYSVEISEGNGCKNVLQAQIKEPEVLLMKLDTVGHVLCNGDNTGLIQVSVKGGVAPYDYSWSNGETTEDISGLGAGKYTLTVTDAHGCTKTASTEVKQPKPFLASLLSVEHIKCNGDDEGAITLNVRGGIQPYVFAWSNGATTQNLSNLSAGKYSVKITDANGCIQELATEITEPMLLTSALVESTNVSCFGGYDGNINITVNGGVTPYAYQWSNGAVSQDLTNVPQGTYSVQITDANGCTDSHISVTITEPEKLNAQIVSVTNVMNYGISSGAIDINVTGGVAPYVYSWSNGAKTQDISKIQAGNYSVNIVDNQGCQASLNMNVKQPPALKLSILSVVNIACSGESTGAINVNVTGGVRPYRFEWNHGDSIQNLSNVPAGDYALTVIDANNHREVVTSKISEPVPINIIVDDVKNVLCYGAETGSVALTITGGQEPYTYSWSHGATSQDLKNIPAGSYDFVVTDRNGCEKSKTIEIAQPNELVAKIVDVENVKCHGDNKGAVRIEVLGGVEPYRYSWSNGEKTQNLTEVIAGEYSVKIYDANGCVVGLSTVISEPPALVAKITEVVDNSCFGEKKGSVSLDVYGGFGSYTYSWSNGDSIQDISNLSAGVYDVIIRDSLGCQQTLEATIAEPEEMKVSIASIDNVACFGDQKGNVSIDVQGGSAPFNYKWSSGETSQDLKKVVAGQYSLAVTDAKGCVGEIQAQVLQPAQLVLALDTIQNNLCKDDEKGLVDITVSGGVTPYQYAWSNGAHTEDLVNVIADEYSVNVKDANGCIQKLTAKVEEPQLLVLSIDSVSNVSCYGDETGYASVAVKGGVEPYTYHWDNGVNTPYLQDALAGDYDVTVTDANGCSSVIKTTIEQPVKLIHTIDAITDIQCHGDSTGSIYVTALEGVGPYDFEWSNGEKTADITGLVAGHYELKITQANGCVNHLEATIEQPTLFVSNLTDVKDVKCFDDETGEVKIDVSGGVEPYAYAWSNGAVTEDILGVKADNYSVMVTDANGCLNTINAFVNQPDELRMKIDSVHNVKCCGDQSGAIFISVYGGVEPYQYEWSNGATTQDIQNLILGKYTVNISDSNGCEISPLDDDALNLYEQIVTNGKFVTRGIQFDIGKTTLKPESFIVVNRIATLMKEHPDLVFRIDGHTDSDGTEESNQSLSERRSEAIKDALIKFGISEARLYTQGWGESKPIATNATSAGKAENRRVEFISLTGTLSGQMIEESGIQ